MNIRMSHAAGVAVLMCVMAAQPAMAQSGKDVPSDKAPAKTYKRKLYTGKDADKYRAMNDMHYYEGGRKNKPKGHADEDHQGAGNEEERTYTQKRTRGEGNDTRPLAREDENTERAERREARPIVREEENADRAEAKERDERPAETANEETHEHGNASDSRRSYRRDMRGSRKDMRRKSREEKWTRSGDGHEGK